MAQNEELTFTQELLQVFSSARGIRPGMPNMGMKSKAFGHDGESPEGQGAQTVRRSDVVKAKTGPKKS